MLMIQSWPIADKPTVVKDFALIKEMVNIIRSARSDYKIAPTSKLSAIISGEKNNIIKDNVEIIKKLARLENLEVKKDNQQPAGWLRLTGSFVIDLEVAGQMDIKKEKDRLQREHDDLASYAKALQTKLSNKEFAAKAPASVVEAERQKLADILGRVEKLSEQLLSLQQK